MKDLRYLSHKVDIKGVKLDIIENLLSVGIFVSDETGKWTYVNNTLALMLGMQPMDMVGNGWLRNINKRTDVYEKWMDSISNNLPYSDIITVQLSGRTTLYELSTLPVLRDGQFSAYVGTIKPIPQT